MGTIFRKSAENALYDANVLAYGQLLYQPVKFTLA
jgi:hypothetical protein